MNFLLDTYAVVGNPIAHSRSPEIHQAFAAQTGQTLAYERLLAPLDGFEKCVHDFFAQGGRGLSVTVPFKLDAYRLAKHATPRAQLAQASNTLWIAAGQIHADNTDGVGLLRDLTQNLKCDLRGKRLLILGAGGAVRGVLQPLLEQQPANITIANRTVQKAVELARVFAEYGPVQACGLNELPLANDVIINATSAGLQGTTPAVPAGCYAPGALAYDKVYGKSQTPFLTAAAQYTTHLADGLGMLVEQAAEAFALWRGVRPQTAPIIAHLRRELQR